MSSRPWHAWYKKFAPSSPEVNALYVLEPDELPEWAIKLRQEFPTVPPQGVEMCHARWTETLDRLLDDIADGTFRRRAHWCGDIPLETVAGLGLRRRILMAWLNNVPKQKLLAELAEGLGAEPLVADLLYDVLGEVKDATTEVRQDIEFIADLFAGPYEAGNAPIFAKWKHRLGELEGRKSVLAKLKESHYPVLTNLCNYRTLGDVDRLIGMVSRQMISFDLIGPCNWSLKFLAQDEPERLSSSIAVVWSLHRYAADEIEGEVQQTPLGVRDQCNALLKRLGHSDPTRAWLAASLGFLVKKWVRRAWHIMEIQIPEEALPDFSFPGSPVVAKGKDKPLEDSAAIKSEQQKSSVVSSSGKSGSAKRSRAPSLGGAAPSLPADGGESAASSENLSLDEAHVPVDTISGDGEPTPAPAGVEVIDVPTEPPASGDSAAMPAVGAAESPAAEASPEVSEPAASGDTASTPPDDDWEEVRTIGGNTRVLTPTDTERRRPDGDTPTGD